jgi:hypothetical protein
VYASAVMNSSSRSNSRATDVPIPNPIVSFFGGVTLKYLVAIGHRPMSYTRLEHDGPKAEEWRHSTVPTSGPASLQCMQTRDNHPRIQCKAVCIAVYQAWPLSGYITYSRSRPAAEHVVQQRGVILDKPILFYLLLHSFIAK